MSSAVSTWPDFAALLRDTERPPAPPARSTAGDLGPLSRQSDRTPLCQRAGKVTLVGAGPGDPELLTVRATRHIERCDALVYDNLVSADIVAMAQAATQKIYVGKQAGRHTLPQEQINALLVRLASEGREVVRLKGGDPFVFGRGGEELEQLAAAGIDFEVVPGITAACGISAAAGIPLTHREYAQACVFVTGHLKDGSVDLDWPALARRAQTVVVYMGVGALPEICRQMIAHGMPASHPAALVQDGTLPSQRTLTGTLASLPELARTHAVRPPALLIIGTVVRLHQKLCSLDRRPIEMETI